MTASNTHKRVVNENFDELTEVLNWVPFANKTNRNQICRKPKSNLPQTENEFAANRKRFCRQPKTNLPQTEKDFATTKTDLPQTECELAATKPNLQQGA